jgi:hypothetical protein
MHSLAATENFSMRATMTTTLLVGLMAAGAGRAQYYPAPGPMPAESFNAQRAYRQFLTSPYSFRTYSGGYPGFSVSRFTPFGYERYAQGPGYVHQEITPRGFTAYRVDPGRERVVVPYVPRVYVPIVVYPPLP